MVAHVILVHIVGVRIPIGEETRLRVSLFLQASRLHLIDVYRNRIAKQFLFCSNTYKVNRIVIIANASEACVWEVFVLAKKSSVSECRPAGRVAIDVYQRGIATNAIYHFDKHLHSFFI